MKMNQTKDECIATLKTALEMIKSKCDDNHPDTERMTMEWNEDIANPTDDQEKLKIKIEKLKHTFQMIYKQSNRKSVEMGFVICKRNEDIYPGMICKGKRECVTLEDCGADENVGDFHTHPKRSTELSSHDILHGINAGNAITCVAGWHPDTFTVMTVCYKYLKEENEYKRFKKEMEDHRERCNEHNRRVTEFNKMTEGFPPGKEIPYDFIEKYIKLKAEKEEWDKKYKLLQEEVDNVRNKIVKPFVIIPIGGFRRLDLIHPTKRG